MESNLKSLHISTLQLEAAYFYVHNASILIFLKRSQVQVPISREI